MTKGWYGNSQQHSLASKGLKTSDLLANLMFKSFTGNKTDLYDDYAINLSKDIIDLYDDIGDDIINYYTLQEFYSCISACDTINTNEFVCNNEDIFYELFEKSEEKLYSMFPKNYEINDSLINELNVKYMVENNLMLSDINLNNITNEERGTKTFISPIVLERMGNNIKIKESNIYGSEITKGRIVKVNGMIIEVLLNE